MDPDAKRRRAARDARTSWRSSNCARSEARRQIGRRVSDDRHGAARHSPSLVRCSRRSADNEALLSFQVGLWETFEGGVRRRLVAHRVDASAVDRCTGMPDRGQLAPMVPVFTGLLARDGWRRNGVGGPALREMLADALSALPPGIERLIIVPDGPLHRLPFDALRAGRDQRPARGALRARGRAVGHAVAALAREHAAARRPEGAGVRGSRARDRREHIDASDRTKRGASAGVASRPPSPCPSREPRDRTVPRRRRDAGRQRGPRKGR